MSEATRYLECEAGHVEPLPPHDRLPATVHVFDDDMIEAINAALAARRPLLVRGEPGTGKSQLARAAACALGRAWLSFTVDARTESRDLLYTVDTVARLAEAQVLGHLGVGEEDGGKPSRKPGGDLDVTARLAEERFTEPGPLWWVFDWGSARRQVEEVRRRGSVPWAPEGWRPEGGAVLLIDEIDKADPAVPNGLLEALGMGRFDLPGGSTVAAAEGAVSPLVIVTTNEERALPDAFVRRCLVLHLAWPAERQALIAELFARGAAHFGDAAAGVSDDVLRAAAEMVADDRQRILERGVCPPGGAEYLDLVRVVAERFAGEPGAQLAALERVRKFALEKHPSEATW